MKKPSPAIFALFGNPVSHSLSPLMHNAAYKKMGIDASYRTFCVEELEEAIERIKKLPLRGVSVTIPFKTAVMPYLDEVDASSRKIGAVNTILHDDNGRLKGYNTDWIGIVRELEESLEIKKKTFAILGAGGTARAAVFGILQRGGISLIINRTLARGAEVAHAFGLPFYPLSEIKGISADCLINTTPVGMAPDREISPLPREILGKFKWVMDCIYNPLKTRLLKEAEEAGCTAINGLGMFVHQGAEQIRIWTGKEPPIELMRKVVLDKLKEDNGD
ncbi:MAG: shikimate dehydrogenase [Deltaproteobacteria bacterium RBG_16_54_11]|nr:MAG: shikimate dehydrogenase [Deltaproteobacteria bacterium RBG_16_54_11]